MLLVLVDHRLALLLADSSLNPGTASEFTLASGNSEAVPDFRKVRMKFRALHVCVAVMVLLAIAVPMFAEHSFAAEFDSANRVTVKGIVTKVEWTSPNMFVYVDMKDAKSGKVKNWTLEMNCANSLKAGWTRDSLTVGMTVMVADAPRARDGSLKLHPSSIEAIQVAGTRLTSGR